MLLSLHKVEFLLEALRTAGVGRGAGCPMKAEVCVVMPGEGSQELSLMFPVRSLGHVVSTWLTIPPRSAGHTWASRGENRPCVRRGQSWFTERCSHPDGVCSHLAEKYAINLPLQQNQHDFFIKNVIEPIFCVYVTAVCCSFWNKQHPCLV